MDIIEGTILAVYPVSEDQKMGTHYHIYHRPSKRYIDMGKRVSSRFQMRSERIVKFLSECGIGPFEVIADSGNLPIDKELGWARVDSWDDP